MLPRWMNLAALACAAPLLALACGGPGTEEVPLDPGAYTYTLTQSPDGVPLWTTPCARKLQESDRAPAATGDGLSLSAARNEFEPVQLVLGPASGSVTVAVAPFPELGAEQRVELAQVGFEQGWGDTLTALSSGASIALAGDQPASVWLTVYVPKGAPAGDHETALTLTGDFGELEIPVSLHVFDFDLPDETHFATQLNVDVASLIPQGGDTDDAKDLLFEHRLTPKSVTWPSGFHWGITWENSASPAPCELLYDEPDEGAPYSIGALAPRYILGQGWNGVGFPNAMLFQFVDNGTPRPATFCGIDRGDHYGTPAYNAEWSQWLAALHSYLGAHGLLERSYYYVQNEPQNDEDHALAAHLCRLTKAAAPNLRIAVSDEPKPEIAEDPGGACGYDIWIAHVRAYEQGYAWQRQQGFGEEVWYYSLDQDPDPYFNPTRVDTDGMHTRIIPWAAWPHRITGWAYYDANRFFNGSQPGVRAELLREAMEDYEYLWLANEGSHPLAGASAFVDPTVQSLATSMTSWSRDANALMALRYELGRYLEGARDTLPVLEVDDDTHPRAAYYLNFQDPSGQPTADPLSARGQTWTKVGWGPWDDATGMGWYGEFVGDPGIAVYGYDPGGADDIENSYVYDDYGRDNLFEFALASGRYRVTVGVGRPGKGYPGDPHNVTVEGSPLYVDAITTDAAPTLAESIEVDVQDGRLSLEVGGRSELTGDWAYTFLAFVTIEPIE
ncbi:MAG: hypothetical protein R3A51_08940 [Nannocystaceae bacterium]|nr:hypothetical protein [Myxococcales bacterium]